MNTMAVRVRVGRMVLFGLFVRDQKIYTKQQITGSGFSLENGMIRATAFFRDGINNGT